MGRGVRTLTLEDKSAACVMLVNRPAYDLAKVVAGKRVVDIGCGFGARRALVEQLGGEWTGVEPFEGGKHTVTASAEDLPFEDASFDVAIMEAVLEHIPDVGRAFAETARVLKPGGVFIGYVAFMECFHEISYSHLSFKALEHYANQNRMSLERLAGGRRFGIDYHLSILLHPLKTNWLRALLAAGIRSWIAGKSRLAYVGYRRRLNKQQALARASLYYQIECLRQSNGFSFLIRKTAGQAPSQHTPAAA